MRTGRYCRRRDGAGPLKNVTKPPLIENRVLFASARESVRPTPP